MTDPTFPLDIGDTLLFVVSIILFLFIKAYKRTKDDITDLTEAVNKAFIEVTDNLNDSHKINSLKIQYMSFYITHSELGNEEYVKQLNKAGFSTEDLKLIGVNEEFIKKNNQKLFPKGVTEKLLEYKKSLNDYRSNNK